MTSKASKMSVLLWLCCCMVALSQSTLSLPVTASRDQDMLQSPGLATAGKSPPGLGQQSSQDQPVTAATTLPPPSPPPQLAALAAAVVKDPAGAKSDINKPDSRSSSVDIARAETAAGDGTSSDTDLKQNTTVSAIPGEGEMPGKTFTAGAMLRGFYVFLGCSGIVLLYLGTKFACSRRRRPRRKSLGRYAKVARSASGVGGAAAAEEALDMFPLTDGTGDDEDEDIFTASDMRR